MRDPHVTAACRGLMLLSIAALIVLPGSTAAQLSVSGSGVSFQGSAQVNLPLWEQYGDCSNTGVASQQFPDFGDSVLQAADDFHASVANGITQVVAIGHFWQGDGPIGPVTVEIYAGDGPDGLPGSLLCSETGLTNDGSGATIDVSLDGSCVLSTGFYWLSVYPVMSFEEHGQWIWNVNNSSYWSEYAFRDPDGLVGDDCSTWGLGITDCGIGSPFPDLCFGIGSYSIGGEGGSPSVPAVGAAGTIVLLLVLLVVSVYLLRHRRTRPS